MKKLDLDPNSVWLESRATTARFDGYLVNIRMYGFTLVTVLLTANALVTTGNPSVDRPAASIVIMALVLALFLLDNYYWELLRGAVQTSRALEDEAPEGSAVHLAGQISATAAHSYATELILAVYGVFVVVAVGIGRNSGIAASWGDVLVAGALIQLVVMLAVFLVVQPESPTAKAFYKKDFGKRVAKLLGVKLARPHGGAKVRVGKPES
jgi:hypothetical protein